MMTKITSQPPMKRVLLIGATGFIGKVVLERLICASGEKKVDKVFVVIRSKASKTCYDRFENLKQSACFQNCAEVFTEGNVVIPVDGDVFETDLGFKAEEYTMLTSDVTHIINLAASTDFDLPLFDATKCNVESALNTLNFAKKCEGLQNYVHCSTAYVATNESIEKQHDAITSISGLRKEVVNGPESLPSIFADGEATNVYNSIMNGDDLTAVEVESMLRTRGFPNTYTFTKCLAEVLLAEKSKGCIPMAIVRPSIVCPSIKYPTPGWVDSISALAGTIFLVGGGFLHTPYGDPKVKLDVVPCDYVAGRLIDSAFTETLDINNTLVIHATAGKENSIGINNISEYAVKFFTPDKKMFLKPFLRPRSVPIKQSIRRDTIRLRVIALSLMLTGKIRAAKKIRKMIPSITKAVNGGNHFGHFDYNFDSKSSINEFVADFDAYSYCDLIHQGVYFYLLRRGVESLDMFKPKYNILTNTSESSDSYS